MCLGILNLSLGFSFPTTGARACGLSLLSGQLADILCLISRVALLSVHMWGAQMLVCRAALDYLIKDITRAKSTFFSPAREGYASVWETYSRGSFHIFQASKVSQAWDPVPLLVLRSQEVLLSLLWVGWRLLVFAATQDILNAWVQNMVSMAYKLHFQTLPLPSFMLSNLPMFPQWLAGTFFWCSSCVKGSHSLLFKRKGSKVSTQICSRFPKGKGAFVPY